MGRGKRTQSRVYYQHSPQGERAKHRAKKDQFRDLLRDKQEHTTQELKELGNHRTRIDELRDKGQGDLIASYKRSDGTFVYRLIWLKEERNDTRDAQFAHLYPNSVWKPRGARTSEKLSSDVTLLSSQLEAAQQRNRRLTAIMAAAIEERGGTLPVKKENVSKHWDNRTQIKSVHGTGVITYALPDVVTWEEAIV